MATAGFSLVYDGSAVEDGSISARDLAPALLAFADLVDEASPLVSPPLPSLALRVNSDFRGGSFEVLLDVAGVFDRLVGLFSGDEASAMANLLDILTGTGGALGLFQLIKKAKGQKPTSVTVTSTTTTTITFEGEGSTDVPAAVAKLFDNPRARKAVERIVRPLENDGFDELRIKRDGKDSVHISRDESAYYIAPTSRVDERINDSEMWVRIVALSFKRGNKWRVSDGLRDLHVSIQDENFLREVQGRTTAFRDGDQLLVTLRTTQWHDGGALKAESAIVRVHQHRGDNSTQMVIEG